MKPSLQRRIAAEFTGTLFLLRTAGLEPGGRIFSDLGEIRDRVTKSSLDT